MLIPHVYVCYLPPSLSPPLPPSPPSPHSLPPLPPSLPSLPPLPPSPPSPSGPLPKTLVDFWRLVWQEKPPTIVMITNLEEAGKIKSQRYWPETGRCSFGPFEISISDEQILADYTIRKLEVQVHTRYTVYV